MSEVLNYRVDILEANVKEVQQELKRLDVEIAEMRGKSGTTFLTEQVSELRQMINKLNKELGEVVGALSKSTDQSIATTASGININISDIGKKDEANFDGFQGDAVIGDQTKEQ